MEVLKIINAVSNLIITFGVSVFMIFVFGRLSLLNKLPKYEVLIIKIGLALTAAGALFGFLNCETPPISEVVLNIGLAVIFVWTAIFHYNHFVKKHKK